MSSKFPTKEVPLTPETVFESVGLDLDVEEGTPAEQLELVMIGRYGQAS